MRDLTFALRQLAKHPGFTAAAVLTLALGIGAATAIFGVVDGILLRPLPYPDADRLAVVWEHNLPREQRRNPVASVNYLAWKDRARSFESLAAFQTGGLTLASGREAVRVSAGIVTPELFDVFGVRPALGRVFDAGEAEREDRVVVLGHGLWQRLFGGDPAAVGSAVRIEGEPYTVLGVMPQDFELPSFPVLWFTVESPDLWLPLRPAATYQGRSLVVFGKLEPGVTPAQAHTDMTMIAGQLATEHDYNDEWSANVVALHEQVVGAARTPLFVLLGAVGFLLLIACANVAHLLLARATEREGEFAVRAALGAGRGRLLRQMLMETTLLSTLAAAVGALLATWGTQALVLWYGEGIPRAQHVAVNLRVLAVTVAIAAGTAVLAGLVPALRVGRQEPSAVIRRSDRAVARGGERFRRVLIGAQVALALALLAGAGLLGRSLLNLRDVNPGFDPDNRLSFRIALPDNAELEDEDVVDFFGQLMRRVEVLPGAGPTAAALTLPFGGLGIGTSFLVEGQDDPGRGSRPVADIRPVTPGYFAALGIGLIEGRDFDERDRPDAPRPYIVNATLARTYWPGQSALGREVRVSLGDMIPGRVVGVVEDVWLKDLGEPPRATIYLPHAFLPADAMYLVVHAASDPRALVGSVRGALGELGPDLPVHDIATLNERMDATLTDERFRTTVLAVFAGVALLLATLGLYGVVSHAVSQRTREIGIRMAIGARPDGIRRWVLRESLLLAVAGVVVGLFVALLLTRALQSLLFGLDPLDPATLLGAAGVLLGTSVLAGWIPARRATRVDPMEALRYE